MNHKNLEDKLQNALNPSWIEVIDESSLHAGHAGVQERGGSHFNVVIVSEQFQCKNKVARQRMVFNALKDEMKNENRDGLHALRMQTWTAEEWKQNK
ncbi:MAG: BolA protein [Alphaproteobacteria bacterium]|jgi:BolA protein